MHVRIEFAQKGITLTQHVTPGSCLEMGTIPPPYLMHNA